MMNNQETENVQCATETGIVSDQSHRPARRYLRKGLLLFAFLAFFVALNLIGMLLMNTVSIGQLHQAQHALQNFGDGWMVVRLAFIAGLIIGWVPINTWLAQRNGWDAAHLARVLAGRWLTLGVLVFVELFLVQRIHEPFTDRWFQ
ncbi:MAG: hypothetical protein L3K25_07660 [Gammaproteobacteria bacterium]|nr:hypothetical protein [Gammaproteobacteria bacterium]